MRSRARAVIAAVPTVVGGIALAQSEVGADSVMLAGGLAGCGAASVCAAVVALVRARLGTGR